MKLLVICSLSFLQALVSSFLSIFLALPLAHFCYRYTFTGKSLITSILYIFAFVPTRVIVFLTQFLLDKTGFFSVIFAHLLFNMPFSFLFLISLYQKLDYTTVIAAQDLGATRWQAYINIIFPFLFSGLVSFSLLLFLLHFSSFTVPLVLGGKWYHNTPSIMIAKCYNHRYYLWAFLYWLVRLFIIFLFIFFQNKKNIAVKSLSSPVKQKVKKLILEKKIILQFFYVVSLLFLFISLIVSFFYNACRWQVGLFFIDILKIKQEPILGCSVASVVIRSVIIAFCSAIIAVFFAFILNIINCIWKKYNFLISCITIMPFIMGAIAIGILFHYISFLTNINLFFIIIFTHIVLNYPFCYRIINGQMILYSEDMHKTAQTYKLTSLESFFYVAVPFIKLSLCKAFCVAFCLSLTEVGVGSVLRDKVVVTLSMAIKLYRKAGMEIQELGLTIIMLIIFLLIFFMIGNKK